MTNWTVTVTGATGKTGRHVIDQATERGWQVRAAARRPLGGSWAHLDWDDAATWHPAFAGSDAAYVIIPFNHPGAAERTPDVLRAAAEAGAGRIVLLSSLDAGHAPDDSPLRVAERTLSELPVKYAIVRPTWFLDNFTHGSFATMTKEGHLRLPAGEGRIPQIDTRDVAALAVAALAEDGPEGILPATGPEAIDHHRIAEALGEVAGRKIIYTSVSTDEFVTSLMKRGFSAEYGEFLAEALLDVDAGRLLVPVENTVQEVLGRPAYSVEDFARHHAARIIEQASAE